MLTSRMGSFDDLSVADLYAGSGALGIEALSRGASRCLFVDRDREAVNAIRANLGKLGADEMGEVLGSAAERLPPGRQFDVILADPPYDVGRGSKVVAAIAKANWLALGGWLAIETARKDPVEPGPYVLEAERDIARARLTLLRLG